MTEQRAKSIPTTIIAGLCGIAVAAAGGAAWWAFNSRPLPPTPSTVSTPVQPAPTISPVQPPIQQTAQVYWLKDTGTNFEVTPKSISVTATANEPDVVLKAAFNSLLEGPKEPSLSSGIPPGTKLRNVKIKNDGIHVDLSAEFTSGGGSAAMTGRLAQILYTATSLQPNAKVWIDVEGKRLDVLGGEGLELEQPLTRKNFQENFIL